MIKSTITALLLLSAGTMFAQQKGEIKLKNGNVIQGKVLENNNEGVILEVSDGNEYEYKSHEIKRFRVLSDESRSRKGYIGFTAGASIPVGDFGDSRDGGAGVGLNINVLNYGYKFSDRFGLALMWFGAANPMDLYFSGLGTLSFDPWSYGGILMGPMFSFPFTKFFEMDLRPMAGYSVVTVPNIGRGSEQASSLAANLGINFRFNVADRVALIVNGDYFYTRSFFEGYNVLQHVGTISIGGGVAYRFK